MKRKFIKLGSILLSIMLFASYTYCVPDAPQRKIKNLNNYQKALFIVLFKCNKKYLVINYYFFEINYKNGYK